MITIRNQEEMEKYYVEKNNTYEFIGDVEFLFEVNVEADINAWNIRTNNINAENIKAFDIRAYDINANNIDALNINARNITAKNIKANIIKAYDINACKIEACDICAGDINAGDINADSIDYYAICSAYNSICCNSIVGRRTNSKHFVLDGELIVGGKKNDK